MTTLAVWTDHDTSEAGPSLDYAPAAIEATDEDDGIVLHVVSHEPSGLWTVAVVLSPADADELAASLTAAARRAYAYR